MTARLALVTGGIGGIGTAACRRLARDGFRVIASDLPASDDKLRAFTQAMDGMDVGFEAADVSRMDSCVTLVERIQSAHGTISILVNGAGITRDVSLRKMSLDQWQQVMQVNLDSVFNLCRLVVDGMCAQGHGRIVNLSSIIGQTGAFGQSNYAAAKAGMHGFTMALAREVSAKGVTVNSISPGYIDTAMTAAIPTELRNQMIGAIPVGRIGLPDDVANAISFLCGEQCGYLTGINLPVNGGLFMSF
ncbi:MAG: acetoacetyl-CoA reductase [Frankiaceae bacterium]|nr:acetoacetyl-CoA reductase [Arenimonas sp.]